MIRLVTPADVAAFAALNDRYMRELFKRAWNGTPERLANDLFVDRIVSAAVAERDGVLVGFVGWSPAYDLHHCVRGAQICDLYVEPAHRGLGVAPGPPSRRSSAAAPSAPSPTSPEPRRARSSARYRPSRGTTNRDRRRPALTVRSCPG